MKKRKVKQLLASCMALMISVSSPSIIWAGNSVSVVQTSSTSEVTITDSSTIKSVQSILNIFGYNCGSADGVMGNQTITAIKNFQKDQGLNTTGEINSELLDYILAGIPLNIFSDRYNTAIIYTNKAINSTLQYCNFDENTEEYCPNNNLSLALNPNVISRKMVGNINVYSKNNFDSDMATGELGAALYAFDISLETPNDAITLLNNIFSSDGEYTADGITFTNYSFKGMVAIKAEYDTYSSSSISRDFRSKSNEDKTTESSSNAKNKYSHEHYDISAIDDEEIPDALNIQSNSDINRLLDYIGQTRDSVGTDIGIALDKNHLSESSSEREWYKINGSMGEYIGKFSMTLDKTTDSVSQMTFNFRDDDKPVEVEPVVDMLTKFLEKEFDKFVRPSSKATGTYTWDTNGYEIEITYHEIDDDLYPGTNFILFTKKK
ncbi:peptidoglycan-binding domain-containing protein [Blautia wexlerae]|uniref:peptidoglycan-binding domain-containing protein n=1 Tax=Blautia wexlerae TaxID=418240 RepID=UPI00156F2A07|nr:peptidoglycan-binding domain-containing protein [Blautia wexlerae]NSF41390.1 peptidoglycan-binding protein [Blautia wexlerae]